MNNKLVCVVNDYDVFNKVVKDNENLKDIDVVVFDNTSENMPVTKRYNDFIKDAILSSNEDFWVVFAHQDFGFLENPDKKLENLDKKSIY